MEVPRRTKNSSNLNERGARPLARAWIMSDVTRILEAMGRGEGQAAEQLLPVVYAELRRLAAHKMASEAPSQTLQPTALVHEAWLKLVGQEDRKWQGKNK